MHYSLRLTGQLLPGFSREQAIAYLARACKLDTEQAARLLASAPRTLKTGLDADQLARYQQALEQNGLAVEAVPETAASSPAPIAEAMAKADQSPHQAQSSHQVQSPHQAQSPLSLMPEKPEFAGLKYKIEGRPDFAFLTVDLPANSQLQVEAGAMATLDPHLEMTTRFKGGLSRLLTGESLFINHYSAPAAGQIGIAPACPGDLMHRYLTGEPLFLQNNAFVAASEGVQIESKWQGLVKGLFSGEGLFLLRASGQGDLWFNSYGAIIEIPVDKGFVVDTQNIVAFTAGLSYEIGKVGGYKSLFLSGEGLVARFSGSGTLWIQTRNSRAFTHWAQAFRPAKGG